MALSSASNSFRLLSPPLEIEWAGFRSDTLRLQQAGWEIAADERVYDRSIQLVLRHRQFGVQAYTNKVDHNHFDQYARLRPSLLFHVQHVVGRLTAVAPLNFAGFQQIDAKPQFVDTEPQSIDDFKIFATPLARTEEIIVEPETVQSLLDRIREMQAPEQARLREKQRLQYAREQVEAGPRQQLHAQIISIAA